MKTKKIKKKIYSYLFKISTIITSTDLYTSIFVLSQTK